MKTYEFIEESWYSSNGCSCCEPVLMECYNILGDHFTNGSAHSVEDCYIQALELEGIIDSEFEFPEYYDGNILKQMCEDHDIEIIIHYDEDIEEEVW